jgi:hypothetical protein
VDEAKDWLWRRETRQWGDSHYRTQATPGTNAIVVDTLNNFAGVDTVLYTRIGANIAPLTGEELARRAVDR